MKKEKRSIAIINNLNLSSYEIYQNPGDNTVRYLFHVCPWRLSSWNEHMNQENPLIIPVIFLDWIYRDGLFTKEELERARSGEVMQVLGWWVRVNLKIK